MNGSKFDWDNLRLFLSVARTGGLGPAIEMTGKSAPTLGRRMLELERDLGLELFRRKAKGYELTDEAIDLLAKVEAIEARVLPIVEAGKSNTLPLVKISAGTWVTQVLVNAVDDLVGSKPVRLRFISAESFVDIGRREAMIGIRNRRPEGGNLAGRKIGKVRFAVYAKDVYIKTWVRVVGSTPSANWVKDHARSDVMVEVTMPQNALELAIAGSARVVLPTFIGDKQTALQRVSKPISELDHDQWLVTHNDDRFLPEVRHVIDRTYVVLKEVCASG